MKITINKFMELSNVEFETPVKIEAGRDVGNLQFSGLSYLPLRARILTAKSLTVEYTQNWLKVSQN